MVEDLDRDIVFIFIKDISFDIKRVYCCLLWIPVKSLNVVNRLDCLVKIC